MSLLLFVLARGFYEANVPSSACSPELGPSVETGTPPFGVTLLLYTRTLEAQSETCSLQVPGLDRPRSRRRTRCLGVCEGRTVYRFIGLSVGGEVSSSALAAPDLALDLASCRCAPPTRNRERTEAERR